MENWNEDMHVVLLLSSDLLAPFIKRLWLGKTELLDLGHFGNKWRHRQNKSALEMTYNAKKLVYPGNALVLFNAAG